MNDKKTEKILEINIGDNKVKKILEINISDKKIEKMLNRLEHYRDQLIERKPFWYSADKMTIDFAMTINLAVDILWRPSEKHHCYLYAPASIIDLIYVESEQIFSSSRLRWFLRSPIFILLESPAIEHWHLIGSGNLHLCDISQPSIKIELSGSGDVFMSGAVNELEIESKGGGKINTCSLIQKKTIVDLYGRSDVMIAPTQGAHLSLTGKGGNTKLYRKADELQIQKNEEGEVCLLDPLKF